MMLSDHVLMLYIGRATLPAEFEPDHDCLRFYTVYYLFFLQNWMVYFCCWIGL